MVFDHLSSIYHSFPGRITAETFKKQITSVIDIWEDWIVFPPEFTAELRERLEGNTVPAVQPQVEEVATEMTPEPKTVNRFKPSTFKPAEGVVEVPLSVPSVATPTESDGEPMDESTDGEADGAPFDDLDGVPIDDMDATLLNDVDGEPLEDIDGVPIDEAAGAIVQDDVDGDTNLSLSAGDIDGEPMDEDLDGTVVVV
jgi:U2-associated protein SR140